MSVAGLLLVLLAHWCAGSGLLRLFRVHVQPLAAFCLSMMVGVVTLSFAPCLVQLLGLPIAGMQVGVAMLAIVAICNISLIKNRRPFRFTRIKLPELYEWPFILVAGGLMCISAWRCFYFPPTPYDMISGPELIAEYAVREQTMINSVFNIDLHTTNNYFKSPFITGLQIIYKLFVCPFGQLWLSVLYISSATWLYSIARERLHPLLAAMMLLFFITVPDLYAYSFLMLYDYSNMVLFFCGFYFLARYGRGRLRADLLFSAFLFGMATYIRTETLILVGLTVPLVALYIYQEKPRMVIVTLYSGLFLLIPAVFYFICINVFVKNFVPLPFDLGSQVNAHLEDVSLFFNRMRDMNTKLLFSSFGIGCYGYFIYFFLCCLLVDVVWRRRFNTNAVVALYGVAVVFVGLPLIGYLLPLADLMNTTKRGVFKLFPLMFFYLSNSGVLLFISSKISAWEHGNKAIKTELLQ